jgi:putative redox protein
MADNTALAVWRTGTAFDLTVGSGHTLVADGQSRLGASPMEMVLAGLAGCTAADVISILEKKRQPVTGMEVRVRGQRADEHPRVYTDIEVLFVVYGAGVQPEAVRRAIELSEGKYCSVSGMLNRVARIQCSFEIVDTLPGSEPGSPIRRETPGDEKETLNV